MASCKHHHSVVRLTTRLMVIDYLPKAVVVKECLLCKALHPMEETDDGDMIESRAIWLASLAAADLQLLKQWMSLHESHGWYDYEIDGTPPPHFAAGSGSWEIGWLARHIFEHKILCESRTTTGRRCLREFNHPLPHGFEGIPGKTCTCMLRVYPRRCEAHPEKNQ